MWGLACQSLRALSRSARPPQVGQPPEHDRRAGSLGLPGSHRPARRDTSGPDRGSGCSPRAPGHAALLKQPSTPPGMPEETQPARPSLQGLQLRTGLRACATLAARRRAASLSLAAPCPACLCSRRGRRPARTPGAACVTPSRPWPRAPAVGAPTPWGPRCTRQHGPWLLSSPLPGVCCAQSHTAQRGLAGDVETGLWPRTVKAA